jgi:hypothetical protein
VKLLHVRSLPPMRPLGRLLLIALSAAAANWTPTVFAVDTSWTLNGNGLWNVPGNWNSGEPVNNTFNVFIDDGDSAVTVTLNVGRTIGNLTIGADDTLLFAESIDLAIEGSTVTNNGSITLNAAGVINVNTDFDIHGPVTLAGNGVLNMTGAQQNRISGFTGANRELINSATHTIAGGGQLGVNGIKITNQGAIDANRAGTILQVDPDNTNATNTGTMRATSGGILRLQGGTFTNTGGIIRALDGSVAEIVGGGGTQGTTIVGGTLATEGSGVIRTVVGDGGVTLQDVALTMGSQLQFGTNLDANVVGTFTNNGAVLQPSDGGTMQLSLPANTTFAGNGVWMMAGTALSNSLIRAATAGITFTNDSAHTIQGQGNIGAFTHIIIDNKGLILANQANPLTIQTNASGSMVNTGTLRATAGAVLNVAAATTSTGGVLQADDASTINLNNVSVVLDSTRITTSGTGAVVFAQPAASHALDDVINNGLVRIANSVAVNIRGTITNNGTVEQNSTASQTVARLDGNVTLSGTGVWKLSNNFNNQVRRLATGPANPILTNAVGHTIQGSGALGSNEIGIVNQGLINADQNSVFIINPSAANVVNEVTGVLRGSGAGGLQLDDGNFNNLGAIEALNGSNVVYNPTAVTANNVGGVLTGGTWRAVSTGGGASLTLRGNNISEVAAGTTVELNGPGSVLDVQAGIIRTPIESTLTTNNGTLRILGGRNFTAVPAPALVNGGTLELRGGTLTSTLLTNTAGAQIVGFGTIVPRPTNAGTIRAAGGTLTIPLGIQGGSGSVQTDSGATLDLSAATLGSSADILIHNGASLNLGANNFSVAIDYNNANFGQGNAFNHRANVNGAGQIIATPDVTQTLSGDVEDGSAATAAMNFSNVHVGESTTLNYQISNVGAAGPSLRGAIKTAADGGNVSDPRLIGTGATAGNFGPVAVGASSGKLAVTFNATSAGPLTGQQVRITDNFDNVADQTLQISGTAYRLANPTAHAPEPVNFGFLHVGDAAEQALPITNNVPDDGFSERLNASLGSPTGAATTNSGSFTELAPAATNNTSLMVGVDTSSVGVKTGTASITLTSTGVGTSGLADTPLAPQTVNVHAQVNNFAAADVVKLSGDGSFSSSAANEFTLNLGSIVEGQAPLVATLGVRNTAAAPSDDLAGSFTPSAAAFDLSGFEPFALVAAGATHGGLTIELDDSAVGTYTGQITLQPRSTNPQPFSMDLAPITIHLTGEVRLGGDYNLDGVVDAADYVVWRNSVGEIVTIGTGADGSGPLGAPDGVIDQFDYTRWRARFGAMSPGLGRGADSLAMPLVAGEVPEPTTALLMMIVGFAMSSRRFVMQR